MPLSKTELLKSRYIVTAPMPGIQFSHFLPGDILEEKDHPMYQNSTVWGHADETDVCKWTTICPNYPHLFRPLPWYEKRDIEDMPEYVKTGLINQRFSKVQWKPMYNGDNIESWKISEDGTFWKNIWSIPTIQPATREEYEAYINQSK